MNGMRNPFLDKGAGRYGGDDPAMARALGELQQQMRTLRADPIVIVTAALTLGGQYAGNEIEGRTLADGLASVDANWGMELAAESIVIVNTREDPAGSTHNIPIGTRLIGRRRLNAGGADTVFVEFAAAALYGMQWAAWFDTGAAYSYLGSNGG